jgi:hypothetical protein
MRNDDGSALVEAVVVLPVMLTVIIGGLDLGLGMLAATRLNFATESAAKCGALAVPGVCPDAASTAAFAQHRVAYQPRRSASVRPAAWNKCLRRTPTTLCFCRGLLPCNRRPATQRIHRRHNLRAPTSSVIRSRSQSDRQVALPAMTEMRPAACFAAISVALRISSSLNEPFPPMLPNTQIPCTLCSI